MRCVCCDKALNDFESTRKHAITGAYLDTCNKCFRGLGIETVDRGDLEPHAEAPDEHEKAWEKFMDELDQDEDG